MHYGGYGEGYYYWHRTRLFVVCYGSGLNGYIKQYEMRLKKGVSVHGLGAEIIIALMVANEVYKEHGYELVVTSGSDGVHGYSSEHYKGDAVDLRTSMIKPDTKKSVIAAAIRERLGNDYDVVLEATHIHCEYDPK